MSGLIGDYWRNIAEKPTLDLVKNDLTEIKDYIVASEASLQNTTDFAKKHVINIVLFKIIDNLYQTSQFVKEGFDTIVKAHQNNEDSTNIKWDKKQVALSNVITNLESTINEDFTSDANYEKWVNKYVNDDEKNSKQLETNQELNQKFKQLVPSVCDAQTFWKKYYYKVHLVDEEERLRQSLLQRATNSLKEDIAWDGGMEDDWEITSSIISTPEILNNEPDTTSSFATSNNNDNTEILSPLDELNIEDTIDKNLQKISLKGREKMPEIAKVHGNTNKKHNNNKLSGEEKSKK